MYWIKGETCWKKERAWAQGIESCLSNIIMGHQIHDTANIFIYFPRIALTNVKSKIIICGNDFEIILDVGTVYSLNVMII